MQMYSTFVRLWVDMNYPNDRDIKTVLDKMKCHCCVHRMLTICRVV